MSELINVITGTGRCGSTILSQLLMKHPDVLMLREFLSSIGCRSLYKGEVSGEGLARLLGSDVAMQNLFLSHGYTIPEVEYRLTEEEKKQPRWTQPGLMQAALYYVDQDTKGLYNDMLAWARQQPTATLTVHYPNLFKYLREKTGKKLSIEASASNNIDHDIFPNLRVLHIHRDGPEAVLSMFHHKYFKLVLSFLMNPPKDEDLQAAIDRTASFEDDIVHQRLAEPEDPKLLSVIAEYWTNTIINIYRSMIHVRPEHYMEIRFEDLMANPKAELKRAAEFFEFPDRGDAWINDSIQKLRPVTPRVPELPADQQELLRQACRYGQLLVGRTPKDATVTAADEKLYKFYGRTMPPLL